ncbi:DUF871 domain-containing protein [Carnobacteriaceae bacterium zg-C25]|nr:DUF871 domain-containing protein [Carnobacteriaceae bacterium zg-C25]
MRRLGLSIYPDKSTKEEIHDYLKRASKAGFSRIFSCLLSVDKPAEEIKAEFKETNQLAHDLGYEVIVDVAPRVFDQLGISYKDLSFFEEIGADGIRLDVGFTGNEESLMTFNPQNLKVEINMSNNVHTLDTIMDYQPNVYNLYGCHNFYPHRYSGLGLDFFNACTQRFKQYGIKTAAFVGTQSEGAFGPWPTTEGLVTLEMHRTLPLDVQVKHYVALNTIDDILLANCYPTQQELESLADLPLELVTFDVALVEGIPEVEKDIVLNELHFNRGDQSDNLIRSTQSRVKYKGHQFDIFNTPDVIKRGDVVIESSEYGHYAGELQIALKDMENSGKSNVVARVRDEELFLLDYIKPWQKFRFRQVKK